MVRNGKESFDLKDPFTVNQCMWLQDKITSLMLWFRYEEEASFKLKNKMQVMLDQIRDKSEACSIGEDREG